MFTGQILFSLVYMNCAITATNPVGCANTVAGMVTGPIEVTGLHYDTLAECEQVASTLNMGEMSHAGVWRCEP